MEAFYQRRCKGGMEYYAGEYIILNIILLLGITFILIIMNHELRKRQEVIMNG